VVNLSKVVWLSAQFQTVCENESNIFLSI